MSEKTEGLDACEAENYRRSHEGHVQPDLPAPAPAAKPAAAPVADEKKAV